MLEFNPKSSKLDIKDRSQAEVSWVVMCNVVVGDQCFRDLAASIFTLKTLT